MAGLVLTLNGQIFLICLESRFPVYTHEVKKTTTNNDKII